MRLVSSITKRLSVEEGFSLVEVLVAVSLLGIISVGVLSVIAYAQDVRQTAYDRPEAVLLAEEGMEIVRNLRDREFGLLEDGTYGLSYSDGSWVLTEEPEQVDSMFTREVRVVSVDPVTKQVDVSVFWASTYGSDLSVDLTSLFTDWHTIIEGKWMYPVLISSLDLPGNQNGLKVDLEGEYAYVIQDGGKDELVVIDMSNVAVPAIVGTTEIAGSPRDVKARGEYCYLASTDKDSELQIFSVAVPETPTLVGSHDPSRSQSGLSVWVGDEYVYLGRNVGKAHELWIYDVSDPQDIVVVGILELTGSVNDSVLSGEVLYLALDDDGSEVVTVDVSDPGLPVVAGSYDHPGKNVGLSLAVIGEYVLAGFDSGDVVVLSGGSGDPSALGQYSAGDDVRDIEVDVDGNVGFLATDSNAAEVQIIDLSEITAPALIGSYDASGDVNGLAYDSVRDRLIAVGDSNSLEFFILAPE